MAFAMAPGLIAQGFHDVVGVHRVDNDDAIAAAAAKGIPRAGVVDAQVGPRPRPGRTRATGPGP